MQHAADLQTLLEQADSLRTLARMLGAACLDVEGDIADAIAAGDVRELDQLTAAIAALDAQAWADAEPAAGGSFADLLADPIVKRWVENLAVEPPLQLLGWLRGMCASVLAAWYAGTRGRIELERGDVFPIPVRPITGVIDDPTPFPPTLAVGHLLDKHPTFRIWQRSSTSRIRCVIDYSVGFELDQATWDGNAAGGRFHRLASIHPYADENDLRVNTVNPDWWFDVAPSRWDGNALLAALKRSAEYARGAVITELALPDPDQLTDEIYAHRRELPDLIIAGSAHAHHPGAGPRGADVRTNETVVYLDGTEVARHRKIHPYAAKYLGSGHVFSTPRPEGITPERKTLSVLSGQLTRLGSVICADLNDVEVPQLLVELGVNLLLVPAVSPRDGAFNGAAAQVASQCQGVTLIANGAPLIDPRRPPSRPAFQVLAGVPRAAPQQQTHEELPGASLGRRAIGIFDPNQRLRQALRWLPFA